jgi:hypothetical protein
MNEETLTDASREIVRSMEDAQRVMAKGSRVGGKFQPVPDGMRQLAAAVADPAKFWALASAGTAGGDLVTAEMTTATIRATAARLAVGDFGPVREALLGQAAWLSVQAVRLTALTEQCSGTNAEQARAELVKLALRASEQAAKVLASAAALEAVTGGKPVAVS